MTDSKKTARVLLVEDEKIIALFYQKILSVTGLDVRVAYNGEEAVAMVDDDPDLDLLVLDINLSGPLDGIETYRRIRQHHDIPGLYVTAYSDPETRERAEGTKPLGFLTKPIDAADLRDAVLCNCRRVITSYSIHYTKLYDGVEDVLDGRGFKAVDRELQPLAQVVVVDLLEHGLERQDAFAARAVGVVHGPADDLGGVLGLGKDRLLHGAHHGQP